MDLAGRRVLVVGASRGIGAAITARAADVGARVVATARRAPQLPGVVGLAGDVSDPTACTSVVEAAAAELGGLDVVVYCPAVLPLARLVDTSADAWAEVLETNVRGAALVTAAALPALTDSGGSAAYLSSDIVATPRAGLGAYAVSKAALDMLVECWRIEAPTVGFTRVTVGPTLTTIASGWDRVLAAELFEEWKAAGTAPRAVLTAAEVGLRVVEMLAADVRPAVLSVLP